MIEKAKLIILWKKKEIFALARFFDRKMTIHAS
jgi:hypothetical protein